MSNKVSICILSLLVGMLTACQTDGGSRLQIEPSDKTKTTVPTKQTERYVKGSLLVGFKSTSDYRQAITELEKQNSGVKLQRMLMESGTAVIAQFTVPKGQEKALISVFQKHRAVKFAEVDGIMTTQ